MYEICHSNISLSLPSFIYKKETFSKMEIFLKKYQKSISSYTLNFCARLRVTIDPESVCLFPKGLRLFEAAMRAAQEVTGWTVGEQFRDEEGQVWARERREKGWGRRGETERGTR